VARKVRLETDLGKVRSHTAKVFEEFAARYEIHFAWGIGASGDHKAGKALDLMAYSRGGGPSNPGPIRKGWNREVAHYAWANRKRLGIDYVIYDQLIISNNPEGSAYGGPGGTEWHEYPGESHANHVHISLEENPPAYRPPNEREEVEADMPTAHEIAQALLDVDVDITEGEQSRYRYPDTLKVRSLLVHAGGGGRQVIAEIGAMSGTLDALVRSIADNAGNDPDQLVAAVRGAAHAGALAALESLPVATVIAKTEEEPS
jgi:hypothetical protein